MIKVSIACLIYKSVRWLQFVYDQVQRYTDLNENEFYFIANDANSEVLQYLHNHSIPHYVHNNNDEQRKEWYINNVYRAYNTAVRMAKGEYVVLINSDMAFTPQWLEKLMARITDNTCVTARLVERGVLRSGTYGVEKHFGNVPADYQETEFLKYAQSLATPMVMPGGLYMPLLIRKEHMERVNYYPEGNILPGSDLFTPRYAQRGQGCISGDTALMSKLKTIGVDHVTAFDSIVYHFQEGELRDTVTAIK